jgi:amino acid adenylation domain-containing protein
MNQTAFEQNTDCTGMEVAIIGMSGRFPGADNIAEFWENLKNGVESVRFFSDEELKQGGESTRQLALPNFVKAKGALVDVDCFDAAFFEYTPSEAATMDPQLRIFHQCVWEGMEDAGYVPDECDAAIGLYAGARDNIHWQLMAILDSIRSQVSGFTNTQLFDKDHMATRIAYKLNLTGPAFAVSTQCSTSLVAVHLACQGLLGGECDMALAGGVSLSLPVKAGYIYQEGMLFSRSGHCKTFDAKADGTVFGDGAGVVVLKRLAEAVEDRDNILAVIRASAVNNDGEQRLSFAAPGVDGQAAVIRAAMAVAQVEPESISYIEAHGTATELGDTIEIEALKSAFAVDRKGFCKIGTVKSNVGHLDAAAGVSGLIKTVLALKHQMIPASLHFETPNPKIDFENSPFVVNRSPAPWEKDVQPRRAGVSSFGIGGTNAHVVLEEWEQLERSEPTRHGPHRMLCLSARTSGVLSRLTENLQRHLQQHRRIDIADAAYTLHLGRKSFKHRCMLVCRDNEEALDILSSADSSRLKTGCVEQENPPLVFMFPGLGAQYVNMGRDLYLYEPVFKASMDNCFEIVKRLTDIDLEKIIYPEDSAERDVEAIHQPELSQIALFVFEYALASLLLEWGIKPRAMIGYSFGEYVAACISGVFSLEDALEIVVARSEWIRGTQEGAMLSIPLTAQETEALLAAGNSDSFAGADSLAVAIDNGPSCVVSGPLDAMEILKRKLKDKKLMSVPVPVSRAIHSGLMDPILENFRNLVNKIPLGKPQIPYVSNVSGDWLRKEEAVDPDYWTKHLRHTVKFADGMRTLLKEPGLVFVEVGPGRDISALTLRHIEDSEGDHKVVNLVKPPHLKRRDNTFLLDKIGRLWLYGVPVSWEALYAGQKRRRISMSTYPFEKQRYWLDETGLNPSKHLFTAPQQPHRQEDIADWFYIPAWKRSLPFAQDLPSIPPGLHWLVFSDGSEWAGLLTEQLQGPAPGKEQVTVVYAGSRFENTGEYRYRIDPGNDSDYLDLFKELAKLERMPDRILHMWNLTTDDPGLDRGYYSLLNIARTFGRMESGANVRLIVLAQRMQEITGNDGVLPLNAALLGPIQVIPAEYDEIICQAIDLLPPQPGDPQAEILCRQVLHEITANEPEPLVALRCGHRWTRTFEPVRLEKPGNGGVPSLLKAKGTYLITGGLGGIGFEAARYLAQALEPGLIITGRTPLKADSEAEGKIARLQKLGARVEYFSVDVRDKEEMQKIIDRAREDFGTIDGVIHAAGIADGTMIRPRTREDSEKVFAAKINGTLVLESILKDIPLDFFLCCSSIASLLSQFGQVGYCAANNFLDAFAQQKWAEWSGQQNGYPVIAVDWDRWQGVGIATIIESKHREMSGDALGGGISASDGIETLERILSYPLPQVIVCPGSLEKTVEESRKLKTGTFMSRLEEVSTPRTRGKRPDLDTPYLAPRTGTEKHMTAVWEEFFGYDRIGVQDDFFELGGDSLKAMVLLPKIHRSLNVEISINEMFDRPTVESLSQFIESAGESVYVALQPAEKREYYDLSPAQKRLFILQQMSPFSTAYNEFMLETFDQKLEKDKLEQAFKRLIRRHESLRTSFHLVNGEPVQMAHDHVTFAIELFEFTADNAEDAEDFSSFVRPFDLGKAPLLRVGLMDGPGDSAVLAVDVHHIVADGVSIGLLVSEVKAFFLGKELPEQHLQYKDFAVWQNSAAVRERVGQQEVYWLEQFAGEVPVLNILTDFERPAVQTQEGGSLETAISRMQSDALKAAALAHDATPFMILLASFFILLSKLSGQEDIIAGTPVAGRGHGDLNGIVGMFVNTLAIRCRPTGEQTLAGFLKHVRTTVLEALQNQDYPFEDLIDRLSLNRDLSRNPLFDVMFVQRNMALEPGKTAPLKSETDRGNDNELPANDMTPKGGAATAKFDLELFAEEKEQRFYFTWEYSTKLFKADTVKRFSSYFSKILDAIIHLPETDVKLADIAIISTEEKERILKVFNNTRREVVRDKTYDGLWEETAIKQPDRTAAVWRHHHVTYGRLNRHANRFAHLLEARSVVPGCSRMVALFLPRELLMLCAIIGVFKAGAAYLPIDYDYPDARVLDILRDSEAEILLTTTAKREKMEQLREDLPHLHHIVYLDLEEMGDYADTDPGNSSKFENPGEQFAYIIYTSGTTGKPKGVVVHQQGMINHLYAKINELEISGEDIIAQTASVCFDISVWQFLAAGITAGCTLILDKAVVLEPAAFLNSLQKERVTILETVPSLLTTFLETLDREQDTALPHLRWMVPTGEALTVPLVCQWYEVYPEIKLVNAYGPTEASDDVTHYVVEKVPPETQKTIPIGKPLQNLHIYIMDKHFNLCPPGIRGEICVAGIGVGKGYWKDPEKTRRSFIPNPLLPDIDDPDYSVVYRTGDIGYFRQDGTIECLGRLDHQVKIRGNRIELGEIESRLSAHPKVAEAVVNINRNGGVANRDYLCAHVVAKRDVAIEGAELRKALALELPDYMIPAYFVTLDKMPLTPSGKIDRKALPVPEVPGPDAAEESNTAPGSSLEKSVAASWQEVLQLDRISVYDNFFEKGGNSLDIIKVNALLKQDLGKEIPVMVLFEYTTIRSLTRYLSEQYGDAVPGTATANRAESFEAKNISRNKLKSRKRRVSN